MVTKANNVLIHLKAIGAAKTAADINKVKSALDGLNDSRHKSNELDKEANKNSEELLKNTRALAAAQRRQKKLMDQMVVSQQEYTKNLKAHSNLTDKTTTRAIKNQKRLMQINSMARAEERARRREALIGEQKLEREKARNAREDLKRYKQAEKLYIQQVNKRNKLRQDITIIPGFRRPFRVAMIASITTLVADALAFVGTGINALGAGAIAGVNGLAPLTGMLITIPATLGAIAQGIGPAIWGVKNFVNAWKGKDLENAGKNTKALAVVLRKVRPEFQKIQKSVGDRFVQGFDKSFGKLANTYLPILDKRLNGTAAAFNSVLNDAMRWFSSSRGVSVVDTIMGTNNAMIKDGGGGILNLLKATGGLLKAASPMLRLASKEFKGWTGNLQKTVFANQKGLGGFFDKSYKTFKGVTKSLGDYGSGLYHLFKLSAPLTDHMGKSITKAGEDFLAWTKSKKGISDIKEYFKEMQPNLDAVMRLAGGLGKTLFNISRSPNFVKIVDEINTGLLPAIEDIVKAADGKFIPNLVKFAEAMAKLAEGGLIDILADIGEKLIGVVDAFAEWYASQSDVVKHGLAWVVVLAGLFGGLATSIFKAVGRLAAFIGLLTKAKGMQKALWWATGGRAGGNYPGGPNFAGGAAPGGGKGGGTVVAGGGGGKKGKNAKPKRAMPGSPAPKSNAKPKRAAKSGGGGGKAAAVGGAAGILAMLGIGAVVDNVAGVSKALSDLDFKAQGSLGNIKKAGQDAGQGLNSMFSDIDSTLLAKDFNTFDGALQRMANPSKWQSFTNGAENVGAAIFGATSRVDIAQQKFDALDHTLSTMPANEAAAAFGNIRTKAESLGVPMDKLVAMFPQYRDAIGGTASKAQQAAGGMQNAAIAADVMAGKTSSATSSLQNLGNTHANPTMNATDNVTQKATTAAGSLGQVNDANATANMTVTDGVTPVASSAAGALGLIAGKKAVAALSATDGASPKVNIVKALLAGLNGYTANPHITTASNVPGAVSSARGLLSGLDGKTATTYIKTVRTVSEVRQGGASGGKGSGPGRWTGGMTTPGMNYTVGERGPEIGVTRSGQMTMLGVGGRHSFSPDSDTAIIPHGATADPMNGNYGYAPDWAKRVLQGAVAGQQTGIKKNNQSVFAPSVAVKVINPSANVDVKRAVVDALEDISRDKEARR